MNPFQGKIYIENGIINRLEPVKGFIEIITQDNTKEFSTGYALPGFVDSHCHLIGLGKKVKGLNLENSMSAEDAVNLAKINPDFRGNWIIGRGWNQEKWPDKKYPDKHSIDYIFPEDPVCFIRADGHAAWVNSKALDIAGIGLSKSDPAGGKILKDKAGNPTGILIDNAMDMVKKLIPPATDRQLIEYIDSGIAECQKFGITEIHDMDVSPRHTEIYMRLDRENKLPLKIHSYIQAQEGQWKTLKELDYSGKNFRIAGLKFYADGALGSRGAAMLDEYKDDPGNFGLLLTNENDLYKKAAEGIGHGMDIAVHAIGDAANRLVLKVYEKIRKNYPDYNGNLRIEHAQHIHPDDHKYFYNNNITASVQPVHCTSDARGMVQSRLSDEALSHSYPWRSLLDNNINIIAGSDFPIETANPLKGVDAFLNRMPDNSGGAFFPGECISLDEAQKAYIETPREITGNFDIRGKIEIGYEADIVIVDRKEFNSITKVIKVLNT